MLYVVFLRLLDCLFINCVYIGGLLILSEVPYVTYEHIKKRWTGESKKNFVRLPVYGIRNYCLHMQIQRDTLLLECA